MAILDNATFKRFVRTLRDECPVADAKVIVKRVDSVRLNHHDAFGTTEDKIIEGRRVYVISILRRATRAEVVDTLIHEWAHALVHASTGSFKHDDAWGVAFAKVYRAFNDCD